MASEIGIALISTILERMAAKTMEKVNSMVVDKVDGIVSIERDISKLQTTLFKIQDIVQVAEEKQIDKQGKPRVFIRNWLRDLLDIGYEARDVLDDFITFSSCITTAEEAKKPVNTISSLMLSCFCGLSSDTSKPPLAILNRLAKDIRSVSERFDEKKKEGETILKFDEKKEGDSQRVSKHRRPEVGPFINKERDGLFLGRENVKEKIMDKILHPDNHVHVVAILGMGGIGKTTLAQSIYNDERVKEKDYPTENRRWLCVGVNKFSAKKVMGDMVDDRNTTGIGILQTTLEKEMSRERFLIVLDDVWEVDGSEWNLLFNPLTNVGKGGLIIITTRKREVCTATNTQTIHDLEPLSKEDSWSIFESCAYVNGKSDSTKGIGQEIVKKLNGFPLALRVVGCSLLHKDFSTWKDFLESKFSKDDEVMSALRWSYNHLPPHLKMCFTYCALFPKGRVLDKKVLVEMWMAHDLIQKEEQERLEDVGAHYLEELVNASLFQCVDKNYMMHDLIHDLAILVSNEEFATVNGLLSTDQMESVRHISITPGGYLEIPRLCKIEKLLTLYTICSDEEDRNRCDDSVLYDVFKKLKSIRVLVLSSERIHEIPDCISDLKHLRYLDVSETDVRRLPDSLCHLYNLQMLAAAPDAVLPRDIVKMVNLRYIRANLSTCKGVGKLTSLQELSSIHVCEGDNIRELGDMQRLRGKLRIKGLENVTSSEDVAGALMEKQTLMDELILEFNQHYAELVFNQHYAEPTISAQGLDALGCPPNLTYLQIYGYIGVNPPRWMVDGKYKFDKLQTLKLSDCSKLKSLPPLGELTSLKDLSLWKVGVKRLGEEFYGKFTEGKVFFPSLESLSFSEMNEWEEWSDIIIENSSVSFFPLLTSLEIESCPKLVFILPVFMNAANFMTSLESLTKYDCPQLQSLPPDFHKLSSLEKLSKSNCPQLQSLPLDFHKLSSLKSLEICDCPQLQSLPPDFHKLSSLKNLCIDHCPQLQSLPPDFHKLSSLESLYIYDCPQLQSLPADGFPPFLRFVTIIHCPLLYERCKDESDLDWHKINYIRKRDIRRQHFN